MPKRYLNYIHSHRLDVWADKPVTTKEVIETLNKNAESIKKLLANMIEIIPKTYSCVCRNALDEARF